MQVPGDPVAVLEDRQPFGIPAVLGEFQRDPGLRGERHGQSGWPDWAAASSPAPADREHAADVARRRRAGAAAPAQRQMSPGPPAATRWSSGSPPTATGSPVASTVPEMDGSAGSRRPSAACAACAGRVLITRCCRSAYGQRQDDQVSRRSSPGSAGSRGRAPRPPRRRPAACLVTSELAASHCCCRCASSYSRAFSMATPAAAASAVTRSVSSSSSNAEPSALLGQVQVAVDLIADPDRHAEERLHRRDARPGSRTTAGGWRCRPAAAAAGR